MTGGVGPRVGLGRSTGVFAAHKVVDAKYLYLGGRMVLLELGVSAQGLLDAAVREIELLG